jgi:C-methyltransferase C-terminal domain/Putative zinc binding domain
MNGCRGCAESGLDRVLDLGTVPAADHFPPVAEPVHSGEMSHGLAMDVCRNCGLAQLADDDTVADEPRGVEPQALKEQADLAIERVAAAGWLRGSTVREFGSPHGGTWIPLMNDRGFESTPLRADVVLDCFGIMHEPNQRNAFAQRARVTKTEGVLLLQYHSIATIVEQGQWNSLRHGHFAYYSLTTLTQLLSAVEMRPVSAWEFDLYGGTVLIAAVHGRGEHDESVRRILAEESRLAITNRLVVARLQRSADKHAHSLRTWLEEESKAGSRVFAYGAASRAVALFSRAGIDSKLLRGVADASPLKQGRRMPGTNIPIVSPQDLLESRPDRVLLTLPDLLPEVSARFPELEGRWQLDGDFPSQTVDSERRKSA